MYIDNYGLLSDAQAFTATGYTTNTVDLGDVTPKREIGNGEPMALVFTVDTAADAASGDETYEFQFVQSANANLSSHDVLASRADLSRTALVAGTQVVVPVPAGAVSKRYIGGRLVLGGTTPSITVTGFLQPLSMVDKRKDYADGITIS